MYTSSLLGLVATVAYAKAVHQGFNCGNMLSDGYTAKTLENYQEEFARAQNLPGTSGWNSARLYTMIHGGTTDEPIAAIQAAIDTQTTLLLGLWASAGAEAFDYELSALDKAIQEYGDDFTSLVVGISVGSEDLYRVSPTGIENDSGLGATPDELVEYIKQTRAAIAGTALEQTSIGHVDTWTAYVNGSNAAVIEACDWLGMDTYPYFQSTVDNSIEKANQTFWDAYDATAGVGSGKEVWITETGWPVSGKTVHNAVASVENAETYWQEVACALIGNYNTWWFTLQDAAPTTPNPSFGIVGSDIQSDPAYDLKCKDKPTTSKGGNGPQIVGGGKHTDDSAPYGTGNSTSSGHATASGGQSAPTGGSGSAPSATASGPASGTSGAPFESQTGNAAVRTGSASIGAGILAIFGLVAAL